jgi:hypothetical protein
MLPLLMAGSFRHSDMLLPGHRRENGAVDGAVVVVIVG